MRRLVFIINPSAGNGRALKKWEALQKELTGDYQFYFTKFPRHAVELVQALDPAIKTLLIAIGGDGTVHEVIEGSLERPRFAIAALSAGSGNDFGRTYTSVATKDEIETLRQSSEDNPMKLGNLQTASSSYIFVNNAGFGFDAEVVYQTNRSLWKKRLNRFGLGKLAYYGVVVKELLTFETATIELTVDGQAHVIPKAWFLVVCNQPYFGGGMKISPNSNPADDILEVTVVSDISRWKLLLLFGTVFIGWHTKLQAMKQFSGQRCQFAVSRPMIGHTDGEYCGRLEASQVASAHLLSQTWAMPVK
ncbi:hypothetical protein CF394_12450 [Tetzosporium hominis]|uniref:DAGKc domain-containing protein n=1 Tax=Tetzosporium hominis TaxID=2020506 RepID=A0A264W0R5_9BACL|nr:diacylglycerol kinase family protein [Tetzosporium hominis]OZS77178.1 hypothetical protein CF394_12450 [Tetzosporium hominis]